MRDRVERATSCFNERDLAGYRDLLHDDLDYRASGGLRLVGADALIAHYTTFLAAFPDLQITLDAVVEDVTSGLVATRQRETGTHTGDLATPYGVLPATGQPFEIEGALFIRVDPQGLAVAMYELVDRAAFVEQLMRR